MKRKSFAATFKAAAGLIAGVGTTVAMFGVQGCLDRPVVPIIPGGSLLSVTKIRVTRIDKVDLLLMVDNSLSMGDKQAELGRRIPELVKALTNPDLDPATGRPVTQPVANLHIGVITSSLGSYGTSACDPGSTNPHNNDMGHLLPRSDYGEKNGWTVDKIGGTPAPATCPTTAAATALSWAFDPAKDPGAAFNTVAGSVTMETATSCVVESAQQDGCGYEAQLESVYHFLVDPQPYQQAAVKCTFGLSGDACGNNKIAVTGIDNEVLKERAAFLRPDSLLAIVLLTDEDDASIKPAGLNWIPWAYGAGQMQRGWDKCAAVPDDFEPESGAEFDKLHAMGCYSCFENTANPNCAVPWAKDKLNNDADGRNLREFHQVQRYGYNFYWGRQRYVNGFSQQYVPGVDAATGKPVALANPIFAGGFRTADLIVVAGILGVPKKLVTNDDGTPKTLGDAEWAKIIDPDIKKRDPHMVQSIAPRTDLGVPKYAGTRSIDAVNGGDRDIPDGDDLQFACIAPRAAGATDPTSDCDGPSPELKSPLCDAGKKQTQFKAYPGLRELRVIHDLGSSGFVASICNDSFSPAIRGIIDKLQAALNSQCLKTVLNPLPSGQVDCLILESFTDPTVGGQAQCEKVGKGYCTPGAAPCRVDGSDYPPLPPDAAAAQLFLPITVVGPDGAAVSQKNQAYTENGNVYVKGTLPDGTPDPKAKPHLICEMQQLVGRGIDAATTKSCLTDEKWSIAPGAGGGWCYASSSVDAEKAVVGDACLKIGAPGTIRFEGDTQPKNGSEVFTVCVTTIGSTK